MMYWHTIVVVNVCIKVNQVHSLLLKIKGDEINILQSSAGEKTLNLLPASHPLPLRQIDPSTRSVGEERATPGSGPCKCR